MKIKVLLAILGVFLVVGEAAAQRQGKVAIGINYGFTVPGTDTKDFVGSGTYWRNIGLEGRGFINQQRNATIGIFVGWNVLNEQTSDVTSLPRLPGDISGEQFRYVNSFPILLTGHYYFGQRSRRGPRVFAGAGVGTYAVERRVEIGTIASEETTWHFGVAPEVGFGIPMGFNARFYISVKYNYAFKANDTTEAYWLFSAGFASF